MQKGMYEAVLSPAPGGPGEYERGELVRVGDCEPDWDVYEAQLDGNWTRSDDGDYSGRVRGEVLADDVADTVDVDRRYYGSDQTKWIAYRVGAHTASPQ